MVPAIMYGLARLGRLTLRRRLGVEGLLAHANLTSAIPRLSISVAALAVSLAMMVAIAVMIGSFRDTVVYWVGQTLKADLFIGPGIRPTVGFRADGLRGRDRRRSRIASRRRRARSVPERRPGLRRQPRGARRRLVRRRARSRRAAVQESGERARRGAAGDRPGRGDHLRAVRDAVSQARRRHHQHPDAGGRAAVPDRGDLLRLLERSRRRHHGPRRPSPSTSASCRRPASRPT